MQIALLLIAAILLAYLLVSRRKASVRAKPQPAPAAAMEAAGPSEQYGPSIDDVEDEEPYVEVEPEPVVEIEPEPVVEIEPAYADDLAPEPVMTAQAVATEPVEREPVVEIERESVVEVAPITSEPPIEAESADDVAPMVDPEPVEEIAPEPVVDVSPHAVDVAPHAVDVAPPVEPEPAAEVARTAALEPEAVLEISYPDMEEAPPGLSVDAFKDIKPVAFGGIVVEPEAQPEPEAPAPAEPEPVVEVEPEPVIEPVRAFEPLSYPGYPGVEDLPPVEPEYEYEYEYQLEPEPAIAAAVTEPEIAEAPKPKKRGFRLPNPELKLPSFGKKKAKAEPVAKAEPKSKGGLKLPQITLPANLQGPLSDVERKIALGCVLAIVAAGALGYKTAPSDDAGTLAPTPAPAASSR